MNSSDIGKVTVSNMAGPHHGPAFQGELMWTGSTGSGAGTRRLRLLAGLGGKAGAGLDAALRRRPYQALQLGQSAAAGDGRSDCRDRGEYRARGLTPIFRLTPLADLERIDALLAERGYRLVEPSRVLVLDDLATLTGPACRPASSCASTRHRAPPGAPPTSSSGHVRRHSALRAMRS